MAAMTDHSVKNTNNTAVLIWMRSVQGIFGGCYKVGLPLRVQRVVRASHVICCVIDTDRFVLVHCIVHNDDIGKVGPRDVRTISGIAVTKKTNQ